MTIYLHTYATFSTLHEMDETLAAHIRTHRRRLNESDRAILRFIGRMSCKYYGACTLKNDTVATATGLSNTQARRIIRKLEKLGIIHRIRMIRPKSKGYGANVIQVCNEVTARTVEMDSRLCLDAPTPASGSKPIIRKDSLSLRTNSNLSPNYGEPSPSDLPLYQRIKSLLGDPKTASRIFGVIRAHTIPLLRFDLYDSTELDAVAYDAVIVALRTAKTKSIRNLAGYVNGILDKRLDAMHDAEMKRLAVY